MSVGSGTFRKSVVDQRAGASYAVELSFETLQLRSVCEDPDVAASKLGVESSQLLIDRLADLRAAESLADLVVGRPAAISPTDPTFTLTLSPKAQLICSISSWPIPSTPAGTVDFHRVWRLKLIAIEVTV
jgi:hypothetical protein